MLSQTENYASSGPVLPTGNQNKETIFNFESSILVVSEAKIQGQNPHKDLSKTDRRIDFQMVIDEYKKRFMNPQSNFDIRSIRSTPLLLDLSRFESSDTIFDTASPDFGSQGQLSVETGATNKTNFKLNHSDMDKVNFDQIGESSETKLSPPVITENKGVESIKLSSKLKPKCTCKKSECLKLYCECFAKEQKCSSECGCSNCHNNESHQETLITMKKETIEKNPLAFSSKYKKILGNGETLHSRGCKCSKTGCVKKYCECFGAGTGCSRLCRCTGCKNTQIDIQDNEIKIYYDKVLRKRTKISTLKNTNRI